MKIDHVVLTEGSLHHVAVRRAGSPWLQVVATFFNRDRASQYAEVEDDIATYEGDIRPDIASASVPVTPAPDSRVRKEFFRPAPQEPASAPPAVAAPESAPVVPPSAPGSVEANAPPSEAIEAAYAGERYSDIPEESAAVAVTPAPEAQPTAGEAAAEHGADAEPETVEASAPTPPAALVPVPMPADAPRWVPPRKSTATPTAQPVSAPVEVQRKSPQPPPAVARPLTSLRSDDVKPGAKSITSIQTNGRDPLLVRAEEAKAPVIHAGSSAQQLADEIVTDMANIMRRFPGGASADDLAELYKVPSARARDAMVKVFARREGRLVRKAGDDQRLVPSDWNDPETDRVRGDAAERILAVLRAEASINGPNGLAKLAQGEIAKRAGLPTGSISYNLSRLVDRGLLAIHDRPDPKSLTGATFLVRP